MTSTNERVFITSFTNTTFSRNVPTSSLEWLMCDGEPESIFQDIYTRNFPSQDLVTLQGSCQEGRVLNVTFHINLKTVPVIHFNSRLVWSVLREWILNVFCLSSAIPLLKKELLSVSALKRMGFTKTALWLLFSSATYIWMYKQPCSTFFILLTVLGHLSPTFHQHWHVMVWTGETGMLRNIAACLNSENN